MDFTPRRVLVCTPHPDDAEMGAGGTIAKWVRAGAEVTLVVCTDGGKGSDDPEMTSDRLVRIREQEQLEAAKILGLREVVFLRYPDAELEDTKQFRGEIVREIRRTRPDVVMTVDHMRRNFYHHRDHRITGQVTLDAVFPLARDHLNWPEHRAMGLHPHKTPYLYFWAAEQPDAHVDIVETLDLKIEALRKHTSQVAARREMDFAKFLRERAVQAGKDKGLAAAEAFRVIEFRR